ncbi:pirin family protein [Dysgonomonas sp. 216]|uniref:pirin family protein n=1 Tax=Dysgonomonas sp. 216 TaxID=2302934 RepID=UPI0013D3A695|nr:pirin family protein [Dysgonomonas sp. 216]NDW19499.1 pirin family protein [Dysgonomonas sp. 216]
MKTELYAAASRGHKNHGWLDTYHTFSFATYYNPDRVHFGALRVINDDVVEAGQGFGTHPHDNMEIVSIPLYGDLEHRDSMGHTSVISAGEVQVMSAGTGLMHSEYNSSEDKPLNFLQIWVFPREQDVKPRYDQKSFDFIHDKGRFIPIVSPDSKDDSLWLNQDVWFSIATLDRDTELEYKIKKRGNGVFAMVIEGQFTVAGKNLNHRDGLGIWETSSVSVKANTDNARILIIDVPMKV